MRQLSHIVALIFGVIGTVLVHIPDGLALQLSPDRERPKADGQYRTENLKFGGHSRSYALYIPTTYDQTAPAPLVVVLHGTSKQKKAMLRSQPKLIRAAFWPSGRAPSVGPERPSYLIPIWHIPGGEKIISFGNWDRKAEAEGFVVVAPNSLGHAFNDGSGRGGDEVETVDDVGFIDAVIEDVLRNYRIATSRVYVVGLSSGGSMVQTLAVERPAKFAAFASLMGHLWTSDKEPDVTRSMLLVFGERDKLNPINGAPVQYPPPIEHIVLDKPSPIRTAELWARRMGCESKQLLDEGPAVEANAWGGCRNDAELLIYIVKGLGHHWPGGPEPSEGALKMAGPYTDSIDATEMIWDFFSQHSLPE